MADFTSISDLKAKVQIALDEYPSLFVQTSPYVQLGLEDNVRAYYDSLINLEEEANRVGLSTVKMPAPVGIASTVRAHLASLL